MNKILKKILLTAKDISVETASQALPGAAVAINGVTQLFDKNNSNNATALLEIENGIIAAVKSLDATKVADAMLIATGLQEIQDGFSKVRAGLKK